MPVNAKELSVLAYANGFTLWHLKAKEDDVTEKGYFDKVADQLREGDEIKVHTNIKYHKVRDYIVTKIDGRSVTIKEKGKEHQFAAGEKPETQT